MQPLAEGDDLLKVQLLQVLCVGCDEPPGCRLRALLEKATHRHHALAQARGATSVEEDECRVLRAGRDADLVLFDARLHDVPRPSRTSRWALGDNFERGESNGTKCDTF